MDAMSLPCALRKSNCKPVWATRETFQDCKILQGVEQIEHRTAPARELGDEGHIAYCYRAFVVAPEHSMGTLQESKLRMFIPKLLRVVEALMVSPERVE